MENLSWPFSLFRVIQLQINRKRWPSDAGTLKKAAECGDDFENQFRRFHRYTAINNLSELSPEPAL